MGELRYLPVTSEDIARIRDGLPEHGSELMRVAIVRALCDTVEHLRAQLDETAEYDDELGRVWEANRELGAALHEAQRELKTLRTPAEVAAIDGIERPPALSSEERERRRGLPPVERSIAIYGEKENNDG